MPEQKIPKERVEIFARRLFIYNFFLFFCISIGERLQGQAVAQPSIDLENRLEIKIL